MILKKHQELRFETKTSFKLTIQKGICEHKGMELLLNKEYVFNSKSFIFAHIESEIKIEGDCDFYTSTSTSTLKIIDLLKALLDSEYAESQKSDQERYNYLANLSEKKNTSRTFTVMGNGKSTFIQTITNYLVRSFKKILITELNPSSGFFLFPGCVGTMLKAKLMDKIELENPLIYFYGSKDLQNLDYYQIILEKINAAIPNKEFDYHFIISSEEINDLCNNFENLKGNCIVLKDERLYHKICRAKSISVNESDQFLDINKPIFISGGIYEEISKPTPYQYFYGDYKYTSYSLTLKNVKIVRIGEKYVAPESALPIGEERKIKSDIIVEVEPKVGDILGVSFSSDENTIKESPVKGFVMVDEIGESYLKVLSAQPSIKCNYLIHGDLN